MLLRIHANKESFVPIDFVPGMNIVLAEQAEDAASTDSRNARGKTTLLLILNYLLGGNLPSQLRPLRGDDWEFTLTLTLGGHDVSVTRSLDNGSTLGFRYPAEGEALFRQYSSEGAIRLEDWKDL